MWTACAFGRGETPVLEAAMAAGGHVRVGFENSFLHPDGPVAADNRDRVDVVAEWPEGWGAHACVWAGGRRHSGRVMALGNALCGRQAVETSPRSF